MTVGNAFPAKDARLQPEFERILEQAAAEGLAGRTLNEEELIFSSREIADKSPVWRRRHVMRWIDREILERTKNGSIRTGAQFIGHVIGEVPGDILATFYGLAIYSDRIIQGKMCWLMDDKVSAAIELDGQLIVSHRPTMSRMAAGAVLPGSALVVGMATQKRQVTDSRHAQFILVHPDWVVVVRVKPDTVPSLRPIAARVNSIADALSESLERGGSGTEGKLAQLERLAELMKSGAIDDAQAAILRAEILGS